MKRSEINELVGEAEAAFRASGWALPPEPRWDVTDFGLGDARRYGLVLINLAEEPEYCEKLMYARQGMETPAHTHHKKKEDIICRSGELAITLWSGPVTSDPGGLVSLKVNGKPVSLPSGQTLRLGAGERVTLVPGVYHAFVPVSEHCVIGEVSTANDDANDNIFVDSQIGRYPGIEEDEIPRVRLVSDQTAPN